MLMIAEGTLNRPVTGQEHRMAAAWLVPMLDAGFLHGGWIDTTEQRLWLVIRRYGSGRGAAASQRSTLRAGRNGFLHPPQVRALPIS
jgi:hypothetical protein